ncbi:MAG TPA: hypothetical protein VGK77_22845 [Candidatus Binatia bacterium]
MARANRAFEMLVCSLAAAAAAVLFLFVVVASLGLLKGQSEFARPVILFALVMSVPVGAWCVESAWRLFTCRERADGSGLLSPTLLIFAGLASLALAGFIMTEWGLAALGRAIMITIGAGGCSVWLALGSTGPAGEVEIKLGHESPVGA